MENEWLTFASSVTRSAVWPVAAVIFAFVLREPLGRLLSGLTSMKASAFGGALEASFQQRMDQLVAIELPPGEPAPQESETPPIPDGSDGESESPGQDSSASGHEQIFVPRVYRFDLAQKVDLLYSLAESSPRSAIMESYSHIEQEALTAIGGVVTGDARELLHVFDKLAVEGKVSRDIVVMGSELRELRNLVAHQTSSENDVSKLSARGYILLTMRIVEVLRHVRGGRTLTEDQ